MSKTIDVSEGYEGLSDDDLLYLAARDDQGAHDELRSREVETDQSLPVPVETIANTGDANTKGESIEDLERRLARMKAEQGVDEDDEEEDYEYSELTNDDLRAEISRRNEGREEADKLSMEGKKADLIATLEADDAENDEG